ncbi:hypothetical protein B2_gp72 [Shigella phage B2]|nr:hypothetical protein B2_gp72 [Shigella phage B2]
MSGINSELLFILQSIKNSMAKEEVQNKRGIQWGESDKLCTEHLYNVCGDKTSKNICDDCLIGYKDNVGYASNMIIVIQKLI